MYYIGYYIRLYYDSPEVHLVKLTVQYSKSFGFQGFCCTTISHAGTLTDNIVVGLPPDDQVITLYYPHILLTVCKKPLEIRGTSLSDSFSLAGNALSSTLLCDHRLLTAIRVIPRHLMLKSGIVRTM